LNNLKFTAIKRKFDYSILFLNEYKKSNNSEIKGTSLLVKTAFEYIFICAAVSRKEER
jgi:hypothetical protein